MLIHLRYQNFIKLENGLSDWEEMLAMSLCKYNIIANSSFSWWGAYFNENKEKIVCYPSVWFGEVLSYHNIKELHPTPSSRLFDESTSRVVKRHMPTQSLHHS